MNADENLVRNYYKAFNEKDFSLMISYLTDDVVHDINQGARYTGRNEFVNFMEDMNKYYDENLTDIVIMTNSKGERAAAEFICNGVYKTTCPGLPEARGQKYKLPVGCFFEIKNNKISRVTNYYNMNDWLDQVK